MTGKTTAFQGKTWKEYTCCPGSLSGCATDKCTSPDGQGGQDCWAGNGEPFTCQTGFIPKMTGQTAPSGGKTWHEYKCCTPPSKCSASQCTSPNGQGGHDCWAGNGEAFTCAAGYSSKMTGQTAPYGGQTWHEYTCCQVGGKKNNNYVSDNSKCVATACREYSKDKADSDCCGKIGETFCADGFNLRYKKNDQSCERWSTKHRGTCCVKNGQKHRQNFKNDKSKCRSHQEADKNCCAFASGAACADGYKMTMKQTDDNVCFKCTSTGLIWNNFFWHRSSRHRCSSRIYLCVDACADQSYKAFKYTCTPPSSLSGREFNLLTYTRHNTANQWSEVFWLPNIILVFCTCQASLIHRSAESMAEVTKTVAPYKAPAVVPRATTLSRPNTCVSKTSNSRPTRTIASSRTLSLSMDEEHRKSNGSLFPRLFFWFLWRKYGICHPLWLCVCMD